MSRFGEVELTKDTAEKMVKQSKPRKGTPVMPYDELAKSGESIEGFYTYTFKLSNRNTPGSATTYNQTAFVRTVDGKQLIDGDGDYYYQIEIENLAFYNTLKADYYPQYKLIWLPAQSGAATSSYGSCSLYLLIPYGGQWYYNSGLWIQITDDGELQFPDNYWLSRLIEEGPSKGYYLNPCVQPGITLTPNSEVSGGIMEYTNGSDVAVSVPVQLKQEGNTVTIGNFMGTGNPVNVKLNADGTLSIDMQEAYYNSTAGSYYVVAYIPETDDLDTPIVGKWNNMYLTWTDFTLYSIAADSWFGHNKDVRVYFTDAFAHAYDYTVDASAPRFAIAGGEGTTGIQSAKAAAEVSSVQYVDMAGRQVSAATKGLVLKTVTYADGTKKTVKVINK